MGCLCSLEKEEEEEERNITSFFSLFSLPFLVGGIYL